MTRAAAFLAAAAAALFVLVPAASAVRVTGIDTGAYPTIRVSVVLPEQTPAPPTLFENGRRAEVSSARNLGRAKSIALLIDRSQSMKGKPLADATAAARAFVAAKPYADRIAVGTFATKPLMATGFSTSTSDSDTALRNVPVDPIQGTTLFDAIGLAARRLDVERLPARVIIVVTDGNETRSESTLEEAIASAQDAGASVYVVAIESSKFTPAPLKRLANETGGSYYGAASSAALAAVYRSIASELSRTWRIDYATSARPGEHAKLAVRGLGSSTTTDLKIPGSTAAPTDGKPSRLLPEVFYSPIGTQLIALIAGFMVLLAATIALTTVKGARLKKRLAPHLATSVEVRKRKQERERLAMAAGLFRATETAFSHWRFWKRLERMVERSDLPLRTVELAYLMVGAALVLGVGGAVAGLSTKILIVLFAVGASLPLGWVWLKAVRRTRAFENQLPDVLITLAAALKAGHSFKAGLQTIVDEGNPPASKEFNRVLAEARLGRPLNDALADMSERLGSKNFDFVITAVTIQQQVGGSLAGLIDMVADTVRQRQQFIRKIKGLTAMGRAGAYVLIGLPFFMAGAITVMNPGYMDPLYHTPTGHKLIYAGLAMMAFGSLILKKIVSFKG